MTPDLTEQQKREILERYKSREPLQIIAESLDVTMEEIKKYIQQIGNESVASPESGEQVTVFEKFAKTVRQFLWRHGGKEHREYKEWNELVKELREGGLSKTQAIIQATKDFPSCYHIFREFDVSEWDPNPDSHPEIFQCVKATHLEGPENEGRKQSHRENLNWALEAAGLFLRTNEQPKICPNDKAYFLYRQACSDGKEFLTKVTQVESKSGSDEEADRLSKQGSERSIQELEEMLETLGEKEEA